MRGVAGRLLVGLEDADAPHRDGDQVRPVDSFPGLVRSRLVRRAQEVHAGLDELVALSRRFRRRSAAWIRRSGERVPRLLHREAEPAPMRPDVHAERVVVDQHRSGQRLGAGRWFAGGLRRG